MQRGKIGKRLRKLRNLRGVSQAWLARKVHVCRQTISQYENGSGIDADLADEVLKNLGGIMVLGADLNPEEAREVASYIECLRKQRIQKARREKDEYFQKYQKKEKSGYNR